MITYLVERLTFKTSVHTIIICPCIWYKYYIHLLRQKIN